LSQGGRAQLRRQAARPHRARCAGRLLADAGHAGRFQALRRKSELALKRSDMKAIVSIENLASNLVLTFWTPVFVGIFIAILLYALRPRNKTLFDAAARMPLRED